MNWMTLAVKYGPQIAANAPKLFRIVEEGKSAGWPGLFRAIAKEYGVAPSPAVIDQAIQSGPPLAEVVKKLENEEHELQLELLPLEVAVQAQEQVMLAEIKAGGRLAALWRPVFGFVMAACTVYFWFFLFRDLLPLDGYSVAVISTIVPAQFGVLGYYVHARKQEKITKMKEV